MLEINEIMNILPHRYPFLLVDRVLEISDTRVIGIKNLTMNETFFQGHFPGQPVMPGVLMLEAMAQLAGIVLLSKPETKGKIAYFAAMDSIRFRRPVVPGDQLRMEVDIIKIKGPVSKIEAKGFVDGKIVVEAEMTFSLGSSQVEALIDPSAKIHPNAEIGKNVKIGPYVYIGEGVKIGNNNIIEAHCVIEKWTTIGENNHIRYGAIIGNSTQDKKFKGEKSYVEIGDNNDIREYVTINRATDKNGITKIGNNNLFLTGSHIAHDCMLGNNIILSNLVQIAGHVIIEDNVVFGGLSGAVQFCRIGKMVMVGGNSKVNQDIAPFMLVEGNPATIRSLNIVGLERNGLDEKKIRAIKEAYKLLFRSEMNFSQSVAKLKNQENISDEVQQLINFLESETRNGFMKKLTGDKD